MTATTHAPATSAGGKIAAFLRLGKARIYHHAYGWLLAVLLLWHDGHVTRDTAPGIALLLLMVIASQFAGGAADDLGGYRDGSDARNYAGRPARTVAKKPLLTAALTEHEAVTFGVVCWLVGVGATLLAAVTLGAPPLAVVLLLVAQVAAVQYSIGLKVSYRPLGLELAIFFMLGCIALMPYWFTAGHLTTESLLVSALFGLWFLMVVSYGNASDRDGDTSVSRHTLAVLLPPQRFKIVLTLVFVASVTLLSVLFATTSLSPFAALAVLPVTVLHAVQLHRGAVRDDWRAARFLGLMSLDLGCVGLAVAILVS
jgi:1,4-dihydroxy-2-naphthoate octaprenyltransferase